ncbi:chromosome-partitioning protein Spo0J [mine drainage metagenome]|uniref:Chromosome-partitioning protein Spo0J n=1 Tax=mine drainage metagenome TaxID=410659 RepID=A0A1J5SSN8_9ZZZZ
MNAPLQLNTQLNAEIIDRTRLHPSPTNPRKRRGLDAESLNELAESIKSVGIAQPILVRVSLQEDGHGAFENRGNYEIIAGERRWRAAGIAGLDQVPCILLNIDDLEVLKIQLVENKQRKDLDELEEAEGYEKLLKEKTSDGKPYTVDMIAKAMGVSRGTIYARMKLLDLCEKARQALYDNQIDGSTALLIARISPEKIQLEALQDILRQEMSYRRAHDHIQRKFMLELKTAVFDIKDASLLKKAGTCDGCPKRTGNQPDLFSDVKSKDVCTDPVCFAMKKAAHFLIIRNKAEAEGAKIISGAEAKKILPSNYSPEYQLRQNGYATPDDKIPNDPKGRTWQQALKQTKLLETKDGEKPRLQPTIIENPHEKGEIIQAFNIEQAAKALREQGYEVSLRGTSSGKPVKTEKEKAEAEKLKAQIKAENLYRARLVQAIHTKAQEDLSGETPQLRPELFRLLAIEIFDQSKAYAAKTNLIATHLGEEGAKENTWEANKAFKKHLETLHPQTCLLIMIDLIMAPEEKAESWHVSNKHTPDTLLALATMHGIDSGSLKKQAELEIKEEIDAKKKAKAATAKPAKKAEKAKPTKPAQETTPATKPARKAAEWPFPTPL